MRAAVQLGVSPRVAPRSVAETRRRASRVARIVRTAMLFAAPALILFLVLVGYPLARVLWLSFQNVNLVNPSVTGFAGFANFDTVFEDEEFFSSLSNTAIWTGVSVAGEYALGLASALALSRPARGRALVRAIVLVPFVIPIVVAGLVWTWMLTPEYGVINSWLVRIGLLRQPFNFLGGVNSALLTVTFVNVWRSFPFYTISLLAALQAVPRDLHEAAAIDGAGSWRRFRDITMPHLRTVSLTLIGLHVVWTAINFDFIWVMTQGGPLAASQTVPILIYRYAMQDFDVGAACALASMTMATMATVFFVIRYGRFRRASPT